MLDAATLELIAQREMKWTGGPGERPPPFLDEVFTRMVPDWRPRNPAFGAEVGRLEMSAVRGDCISPLLQADDVIYIDRDTPPQSGDIVSFALSRRGAAAQNMELPPGQSLHHAGDCWCKLMVIHGGRQMLLDRHGGSATATLMACESPDDTPILHAVRNIVRGGRLLFTPDHHASQIGDNAATEVGSTSFGPTDVFNSSVASTQLASLSVPAYPFQTEQIVTAVGSVDLHAPSGQFSAFASITDFALSGASIGSADTTIARNPSSALPDDRNSYSRESRYTVPASTAKTYYFNGQAGGFTLAGASTNMYGNFKVEVIKR